MSKLLIICLAITCCAADAQQVSPVDSRIAAARSEIKKNQTSAASFNNLAFALIRKGRDFQDESLYLEAGKAVDQSLHLSPANFEAQKLRTAILLGLNQSAEALKLATQLNRKTPDDLTGWALLVDGNVQLGNYDEAERDAQWILDLRPGSSLGFEKAAMLRELFGDWEGAIEFFDEANRRTSPHDADQKSWLLTQKAHLVLLGGNADSSANILTEAIRLFPDSQLAAAGLAQVRIVQGNYPEALKLLEARYHRVPNAANLYDWAEALSTAGHTPEAAQQFAAFEKQAGARPDSILQLIGYYADTKPDPPQALSLASKAASERHDSATLAAYAWALYRNDRFADAKLQMDKALAVGVRDPIYFCHAAAISASLKDTVAVDKYTKELSGMPKSSCALSTAFQTASKVKP
jgi:tetratricopeptide (TPR) repeat protein